MLLGNVIRLSKCICFSQKSAYFILKFRAEIGKTVKSVNFSSILKVDHIIDSNMFCLLSFSELNKMPCLVMMMMMMIHMFANLYTYSTYICIFIDIKITNKKILFQDVIRKGVKSQITFTDYPFLILGTKRLDCTNRVDPNSSKTRKNLERKIEKGCFCIVDLIIILTNSYILVHTTMLLFPVHVNYYVHLNM